MASRPGPGIIRSRGRGREDGTISMHRPLAGLLALATAAALCAGCGSAAHPSTAATATTTAGQLRAPKTSYEQDTLYFQDLAKVDQALTTYVDSEQQVALQALLTDGSAFCAFLARGGGVDAALDATAVGANSVEEQTHLPQTIETFNSIEAVALVTLCPSEQKFLPSVDKAHIKSLEQALSTQQPSASGTLPASLPAS